MTTANSPITKDWFVFGLMTGSIGAVGKTVVDGLFSRLGLPSVGYHRLGRQVLIGKKVQTETPADVVMNTLADMALGGIVGTALHGIHATSLPGNEVMKGMLGGTVIWAGAVAIGNRMGLFEEFSSPKMASMLATNMLFGCIQGALIGKYQASTILQSHPILVQQVDDASFRRGRMTLDEDDPGGSPAEL